MKSYFLDHMKSVSLAEAALRAELPGQEDPWTLFSGPDDAIAYFRVASQLDGEHNIHIQADVSGRHCNEDELVLDTLRRIQTIAGGSISSDA